MNPDQVAVAGLDAPDPETAADILLRRVQSWYRTDNEAFARWWRHAEEDAAFVDSHQYSEAEEAELREMGRPTITFNRLAPIIDVIAGLEINNRQEISCRPRSIEDESLSEGATALVEWCRDTGDAEDAESDMFVDQISIGMGWAEQRLDEDDYKFTRFERIDPAEMRWQASAKARNLEDAKRIHRVRAIDRSDAEALFPDVSPELLDAAWARGEGEPTTPHDSDPRLAYTKEGGAESAVSDKVTIVETQWVQRDAQWVGMNPETGAVEPVTETQAKVLQERGIPVEMTGYRNIVYRAFCGATVLEALPLPVQDGLFTYQCATGKYDRKDRCFYGIVRAAKDPQRYANKWLSMSVEIMAAGAKGSAPMMETDAVEDPIAAEEAWADSRKILWLKEGAIGRGAVMPRPQVQYPQGYDRLLTFAISAIRDVTGINLEILGMRDATQPGVLEYQRKQATITILAKFFDNLRRHRKRSGRLTLCYIVRLMEPAEMLRVLGPKVSQEMVELDDGQPVPLLQALKQYDIKDYDVVVDESPQSPNAMERNWLLIQPMLPLLVDRVPPEILAEVVRAAPLPSSLKAKLVSWLETPPQPDPKVEHAAELEFGKTESEIEKNRASAIKAIADAMRARKETEIAPIETAIDAAAEVRRMPYIIPPTTPQAGP